MSTAKESRKFYNEWVDYLSETKQRHARIFEGLKMCRPGPGVSVLDLGCGTGITSEYLAKAGCKVLAVDFAEELIKYGKENRKNKNLEWLVADITKLDLNKKFDLIVLADVLEHVEASEVLPLLQVIFDHSFETTFLYLNLPYWPWQEFAQHYGIGDAQPIDNRIDIATALNLFVGIHYLPMHMDIYGMATPLEYVEIIFARREEIFERWRSHYGNEA